MLATLHSATVVGIDGQVVTVEVHVSNGLPGFTVVGLPDATVREARERVRAALLSSDLPWPTRRVTVNLAPGWVRKTGASLDLAFAVGVLVAMDSLPAGALDGVGVIGELGLDGSVRAVPGTLAMVSTLHSAGTTTVVVPAASAAEGSLVNGARVLPATSLSSLRACLKGEQPWPEPTTSRSVRTGGGGEREPDESDEEVDLADVRGLPTARLALEAAAAGGHHLLLVGPPGAGKTMLARRIPTILPPLDPSEALEVTRIRSAAGGVVNGLARRRPFRAPHHTASTPALVGGGSGRLTPGEVTLAHRGVLFMDELGEFSPTALDALRQPLEDRCVRISRQGTSLRFPADFALVACSNPCPCGMGPPKCICDPGRLARYRRRLSSPLLDRFDLRVLVTPPEPGASGGPPSNEVLARVLDAVARQRARYRGRAWTRNVHVPAGAFAAVAALDADADALLRALGLERGFTGRGVARVQRVARTFADLAGRPRVGLEDVCLAADLRAEVI